MIYTDIKTTILLSFCLFCFFQISAQTLDDLTHIQKEIVERRWSVWTHTGKITLKDNSSILGQVVYPTDSGIVWRSVPQYFPYADTNIHLISYRDISQLQINRSPRLDRHMLNGAVIGGALLTSATYAAPHSFRTRRIDTWAAKSSLGIVGGFAAGLITGIIIDKVREQQVINHPNIKNIRKATLTRNLLYTRKKKDFWRKHWIQNDSLIAGYALPPELGKLRPYRYNHRFQFSAFVSMQADKIEPTFQTQNGQLSIHNDMYHLAPRSFEMRASYQLKPWLKLGALTHRTHDNVKIQNLYSSSTDINMSSQGFYTIRYQRSWGLFAEYTPFPVTYLTLRKWEFNLGAGVIRELVNIYQDFPLYYYFSNGENNFDEFYLNQEKFVHFGALSYLGLSIHLNQYISIETQFGHYFFKKYQDEPFSIDLIDPLKDITFTPRELNFSRSYLSFGASLRL